MSAEERISDEAWSRRFVDAAKLRGFTEEEGQELLRAPMPTERSHPNFGSMSRSCWGTSPITPRRISHAVAKVEVMSEPIHPTTEQEGWTYAPSLSDAPKHTIYGPRGENFATVYNSKDRARLVAAAPTMKAVLDDLEDAIDKQTSDERMREELEIPLEREYSVNLTERQIQAITRVLNKAGTL